MVTPYGRQFRLCAGRRWGAVVRMCPLASAGTLCTWAQGGCRCAWASEEVVEEVVEVYAGEASWGISGDTYGR